MQFNGEANNQDICTLADKLVKTDDTDFPLEEKSLYANMAVQEILSWILSVYGGWTYDSSNESDLPTATTDLENGKVNYTLPDILELKSVSYKIQDGDSWEPLIPITLEEIQAMGYAEPEFERTAGTPRYYRPIGNVIKIYPAANFDQDDSLEIQFNRDSVTFTPASTSTTPGFVSIFHPAISTFMALKFAEINSLDSAPRWQKDWDGNEANTGAEGGYKKKIKAYYRSRFVEKNPPTMKKGNDILDQYI